MMGFLAPLWLALGAAVAVPIVLHLVHRHHGPRVVFPALRYLRRAERDHARRIRLRQLLLLALRVAAIVLLALAVARPFIRSEAGAHRPTAVALVIDNGLSSGMVVGDRRVLDLLKERALETLAAAGPDDRFWLVQAGAPWRPAVPGDAASIAERVLALEPTPAPADLETAVVRAQTLLAAGAEGRAREVHLLSDLATPLLGTRPPGSIEAPAPVIAWRPPGDLPTNRGVAEVVIAGGLPPRAGERAEVHVMLAGDDAAPDATPERADATADSTAVRLVIDGRVLAVGRAFPGVPASLSLPPQPSGTIAGWVEIDPDALRGDDRRYFAVRVQPPPRVAAPRALPFLGEALQVLADAGRIEWASGSDADVVLAPAAQGVGSARAGGTVVVLPPEDPLQLPAANQRLAAAGIPWRYELPRGEGDVAFRADAADAELARVLEGVRVRLHYPIAPATGAAPADAGPGGSAPLLALADGSPWAVRGETPGGVRYVLVGSPLTREATTLPTSTAMVPLLDRMLGPWAAAQPARTAFAPGEAVPLPPGSEYVERPDGRRDPVSGSDAYAATELAGIYRVLVGGEEAGVFVVNHPPEASRLARAGAARLRDALPGVAVRVASDAEAWRRLIYAERQGREIARPLLLLAFAVLLFESCIAATGWRARRAAERAGASGPEPSSASPRPGARAPAAAGATLGSTGS